MVSRSSTYNEPPAQSGSVGNGSLGAPGRSAECQVVATSYSRTRLSASSTAPVKSTRPPADRARTPRCRAPCRQPRAAGCPPVVAPARLGTGVTSPTQWLDRLGVRNGDAEDPPAGQTRDLRVAQHHPAVGEDLRPADVEAAADLPGNARGTEEVAQHITNGDRLDARVDPPWRDHHRQPLGQVAQHLKRSRARSQDDRRPQHHRRHAGAQQDLAHLAARRQMRGQLFGLRGQATQIDQSSNRRAPSTLGERGRGLSVTAREPAAGTQAVHQVVGNVDTGGGVAHGVGVGRITGCHLDVTEPRPVAQLDRTPRQAADRETRLQQLGDQPPTHITGRTRDQRNTGRHDHESDARV